MYGLFELLEIDCARIVLIALLDNLIHTFSIYLLYVTIAKQCFQLFFIDLSVAIFVKQFEKFIDVACGEQIFLGETGSKKFSVIDPTILINVYRIHECLQLL